MAGKGAVDQEVNAGTVRKRWRHGFLPMTVDEYLQLLDWAGRVVVEGKSGSINPSLPPILARLGLVPSILIQTVAKLDEWFGRVVGSAAAQLEAAVVLGTPPLGS